MRESCLKLPRLHIILISSSPRIAVSTKRNPQPVQFHTLHRLGCLSYHKKSSSLLPLVSTYPSDSNPLISPTKERTKVHFTKHSTVHDCLLVPLSTRLVARHTACASTAITNGHTILHYTQCLFFQKLVLWIVKLSMSMLGVHLLRRICWQIQHGQMEVKLIVPLSQMIEKCQWRNAKQWKLSDVTLW